MPAPVRAVVSGSPRSAVRSDHGFMGGGYGQTRSMLPGGGMDIVVCWVPHGYRTLDRPGVGVTGGEGASVSISADPAPAAQPCQEDRATQQPFILVVDDEPAICDLVAEMLTDEGYRVSTATSGAAALQLCQQEVPHLVLCDQMMPEMSGAELCRQLRMDPRYATIRMILMSAASDAAIRDPGPVDAFLKKPFQIDRLVHVIAAVLETGSSTG